jgi:uncharacterized protein YndB with AHSA1/START domain
MEPTVTHNTFVIERTYPKPVDKVFHAFADPATKQKWFAGNRDTLATESHQLDFQPGGTEVTRYRFTAGPFQGTPLVNHTTYQDIVPGKRIVFAYTMTIGDHRMSAALVTIELRPEGEGTHLTFTEQAAFFEHSDGPEMRKEGWTKILANVTTAD